METNTISDARARDSLACPSCKGSLDWTDKGATCPRCAVDYSVHNGIAVFTPPKGRLTIDPEGLRLKDKQEAVRTIADMMALDSGFITHPRFFYLIYFVLALSLVFRSELWIGLVLLVLATDWVYFRWKRARTLTRFAANPLRLRTAADNEALEALYTKEGKTQPTMAEWVKAAGEATGDAGPEALAGNEHAAGVSEEERYLEIRRVFDQRPEPTEITVDVGANDGLACHHYGIGANGSFIGVDISPQLLARLKEKLPEQTAVAADGGCLPIRDESVDFLFSTETLEHIEDPFGAMREFGRVLRPGGWVLIQSPNAHRIRNLNAFHLLTLMLGLIVPRVLQPKLVHENTWTNAVTYHWDFTVKDYRNMSRDAQLEVAAIYSQGFFVPRTLLRTRSAYQKKEALFRRLPIVRHFGDDLVLLAKKPG